MERSKSEPPFGGQYADSLGESPQGMPPGVASRINDALREAQLPDVGRRYVLEAALKPSRHVGGGTRNVTGLYPSGKCGSVRMFESRTLELAAIEKLEHDDNVLVYFDQPPPIKVKYVKVGRARAHLQTPDFLSVERKRTCLVEAKRKHKLEEAVAAGSTLYECVNGCWTSPPAQEAAREMGMTHEIWTEDQFPVMRHRNLRVIEPYLDRRVEIEGFPQASAAIVDFLRERATATIEDALRAMGDVVTVDHVFLAIAKGLIAADLDNFDLGDHQRARLFRDRETMVAYRSLTVRALELRPAAHCIQHELKTGTRFAWDGGRAEILNLGASEVVLLRNGATQSLPRAVFDGLVRDGAFSFDADAAVDWATERRRDAEAILQKASSQDLKVATIRLERLQPYLQDTTRGTPSSRTLRRYLAQYRFAESTCGVGFVGLIPGWRRSGNRVPRLLQAVLDEVTKVAKEHFTTEKGLSFKRVHERVTTACEEHSLPIPSYAWTAKFLKRLPAYATKRAREGSKAAYSLQERMPIASSEPVGLPRPLRRVHVDHTEIDVETIFAETGESLGRAWLTIGICEDTRRVVGLVLTYEPPSYRAVLLFLRDMIRRFGRLPDTLVVDGGKEFRSIWVEAFAATNHMRIERRPPAKPRFGSQIERYFGTLNQMLIHCLAGHTKLRKNVRQMTSSVDPSRSAVWTLCELSRLIEQFIFEVYDELPHRATLMTPKQAFAIGLRTHGSRPMRHIAYDEAFLFSTMPSTRKGTAKVQVDGVKINYLYYTSPALYRHFGQVVEIRYDPFDLSRAFALLDGQWQQVRTRHIGIFEGRSEGELQTLVDEWRQRRRWVEKERLTETKLARFLEEIEHTESLLKARRRAAEDRQARRLAEGADTVDAADAGDERVGAPMVQPQPSDPGNADPFGGLNDQSLDIKCEEAN